MLILGRTYADGSDADYKSVNMLQTQYKMPRYSPGGLVLLSLLSLRRLVRAERADSNWRVMV